MAPTSRDFLCASVSAALGAWALYKTQAETKDTFEPIVEACTAGTADGNQIDLVAHEPLLGGSFVCIITQFVHRLVVNSPEGFITWALTIGTMLPVGLLTSIEAGRSGASGPVRYPTVLSIIAVVLGVSVSFPLIWVPGFLLLGGSRTGAVPPVRPFAAVYLSFPSVVLTFLAFNVDPSTYQWTVVAGLLGGPVLAMAPLLLWRLQPRSSDPSPGDISRGAFSCATSYAVSSLLAFSLWAAVVRSAVSEYGLALDLLWAGIWTNADPCVRFMTIDAGILFLSALSYIASVDHVDAAAALLVSPLIGPGAACGTILWGHERVRAAKASLSEAKKKKKEKAS